MTTDPKDTSWKVQGKKWDPKKPNAPLNDDDNKELIIPQKDLCVEMKGYDKPLGRPIDANLAVKFIYNFIHNYRLVYDPGHFENYHDFLNSLSKDELVDLVLKGKELNNKMANLNYAMSLDRNVAQKILSQPKCEGLRFYLCARPNDKGEMDISLVIVGINAKGYDLNYNKPKTIKYNTDIKAGGVIPSEPGTKSIKDITMQSLTGEYVTPPYGKIFETTAFHTKSNKNVDTDGIPDEFILLRIAAGQV